MGYVVTDDVTRIEGTAASETIEALTEALEELVRVYEALDRAGHVEDETLIPKARAALAKARGE